MTIGELASHDGVGIDTVRYDARQGLLPAPRRIASAIASATRMTKSGCSSSVAPRRRVSARPKFATCWCCQAVRDDNMAHMKAEAIEMLADVEAKLAELQRIRAGLQDLVTASAGHGVLTSARSSMHSPRILTRSRWLCPR